MIRLIKYDDEVLIGEAASLCYDSRPRILLAGGGRPVDIQETPREFFLRLVRTCIRSGHHSVLEFADATFEVECSRACSHQIVRHRMCSYAQRSQRYVRETSADHFVVPESLVGNELYLNAITGLYTTYDNLVATGIRKEDARFVLPNAVITKLRWKASYREWRHIIDLRCGPDAQWEIRNIALEILQKLWEVAPNTFGDLYKTYVEKTS